MLIDISSRANDRQLRWFAGLWFPALSVMAGMIALRRQLPDVAYAIWLVTAILSVAGLARPSIIRPVYKGLTWLTFPVGWVLSHVLLLVLYYLVITPIGLVVRAFHDPMHRRFDHTATTYWSPRESFEPNRYFRQF